jgi:hypothetical protein
MCDDDGDVEHVWIAGGSSSSSSGNTSSSSIGDRVVLSACGMLRRYGAAPQQPGSNS